MVSEVVPPKYLQWRRRRGERPRSNTDWHNVNLREPQNRWFTNSQSVNLSAAIHDGDSQNAISSKPTLISFIPLFFTLISMKVVHTAAGTHPNLQIVSNFVFWIKKFQSKAASPPQSQFLLEIYRVCASWIALRAAVKRINANYKCDASTRTDTGTRVQCTQK